MQFYIILMLFHLILYYLILYWVFFLFISFNFIDSLFFSLIFISSYQALFSGSGDIYMAMAAQIMKKQSVSTVTPEERNKAKVICLGNLLNSISKFICSFILSRMVIHYYQFLIFLYILIILIKVHSTLLYFRLFILLHLTDILSLKHFFCYH